MAIFCTISTYSHLFKSYALADSIQQFGGELKVLLVDSDEVMNVENTPANIEFHHLGQINFERIEQTKGAYKKDKLRWALKPAYLLYLLPNYQELIYVDNDVFFYTDFNFLFEELRSSDVLLTPHFYPSSPKREQTWLESNFRLGLYNAGFVGVNQNAKKALEWWSDCCLYEIRRSYWRGLFDDQKYLDLLPVLFDNVKIIKNRGCNFAGWSDQQNLLEKEIVFIHFNAFTISEFKVNSNPHFASFTSYLRILKKYNRSFQFTERQFDNFKIQNTLYYLRWKLARMLKVEKTNT
ncbi:hypothetical protein N9515_04820 [Vicingaceae bacterium]|nr:hypothetical protein [Vicingaceae bacterium]